MYDSVVPIMLPWPWSNAIQVCIHHETLITHKASSPNTCINHLSIPDKDRSLRTNNDICFQCEYYKFFNKYYEYQVL